MHAGVERFESPVFVVTSCFDLCPPPLVSLVCHHQAHKAAGGRPAGKAPHAGLFGQRKAVAAVAAGEIMTPNASSAAAPFPLGLPPVALAGALPVAPLSLDAMSISAAAATAPPLPAPHSLSTASPMTSPVTVHRGSPRPPVATYVDRPFTEVMRTSPDVPVRSLLKRSAAAAAADAESKADTSPFGSPTSSTGTGLGTARVPEVLSVADAYALV